MAIIVEQLINEAIILFTVEGAVDKQAVVEAYCEGIDLAQNIPGPVYRVFDLSRTSSDASDVIASIYSIARDVTGAAVDPQLAAVFVGKSSAVHDMRTGGAPFFDNRDEAFAFARQQVGERVVN